MPDLQVTRDADLEAAPAAPDASAGMVDGPGGDRSGLSIIASKITGAAPARSVLRRPRLVDWFGHQGRARLILVSAEAGYGKSTLLNDFALESRDRCAWYRMEPSDGDWITFLSYMVAALREIAPGFGRSTEALLRSVAAMGPSREVVVAQFLADLGSSDIGRAAVILDDYQYVEASDDVRLILSRMLERAPEGMYFVLGGRGRPNLALGRLLAQGRVAELTVDDLRFTRAEMTELFSVTYGQPLDDAALSIVAERTDGWPAALQLVAASIAATQPAEVTVFIDALSGADAPVFDFLAEEVLTRLDPRTERVLMHASLMDRVRPELVAASLADSQEPLTLATVEAALDVAETLGLLGERGRSRNGGRRIHPLFREFLQSYLSKRHEVGQIRQMHTAIAVAAERNDWLVAAKHYALAEKPRDGLRVLGSAASEALGTGAWGAAVEIVALMPATSPPPAVKVIQARALVSDGFPDQALSLLADIDARALSPEERGLVGLTRAAIHHVRGEGAAVGAEVEAVAEDERVPPPLHAIAISWRQMLEASAGGCISDLVQMLRRLAIDQRQAGLHYYAGVTLHNTANAELARGNYTQALNLVREALIHLDQTDEGMALRTSTQSIAAAATAERGDLEEGLRMATACANVPGSTADAIAEAAYLHAVCGRTDRSRSLLASFDRGDAPWGRDLPSQALGCYAKVALRITEGDLAAARCLLEGIGDISAQDVDAPSRNSIAWAALSAMGRETEARALTQAAVETIAKQNAWRWMPRARMLEAVVNRDGAALANLISEAEGDTALAVLELADAIATVIGSLVPLPDALERSILREPSRWMGALRRQVRTSPSEDASAAASLIARFGTAEDAPILREYERAPNGRTRRRGLTTQLIRRVSPTVRVHDLGLTSYEIGNRLVTLTETRRKPAGLLLYLVSRANQVAHREQVMEALWPDQNPRSAMNSLHQTLFFLRRDIEPWYEDGSTADYIRVESDLVILDQELFQIDSVAFARQASDILASGTALTRGQGMLRLYRGGFAPEFEYEEWPVDWRTHLHGVFLRLAHATSRALIHERRVAEVIEVLSPVIAMDPAAFELRATLIASLAATGAIDAAHAHYRSMAAAHERELGLPARSFDEVITGLDVMGS